MESVPAIRVQGLEVVRTRRTVLSDVSFTIPPGQLVGLLGPSGSGKSTLLRSLLGLQIVKGGEIDVLGVPGGSPELRRRIGYVSQEPAVYSDLTVMENLRYFASVLGVPQDDVLRVLAEVDLEQLARSLVGRLSGGERARVSLATALLGRPGMLILDEPTVGVDPILRRDLWDTFVKLATSGATVVVSSHVMDEAAKCERLLLLREGRILADVTPTELLERAGSSSYDAAFVTLIEQAP
ncbi:MAG: ABC transporter ATP-binding protein [Acidimicrobiales bacterium]